LKARTAKPELGGSRLNKGVKRTLRGHVRGGRFILAAILLPAAILAACEEPKPTKTEVVRPVKAVRVSDASQLSKRWFPGRAKATREVTLAFRVSGQLITFPVNVGDKFEEGAPLAKLDPASYQAEADRIAANLQSAQASLDNARQQYQRDETLFKKGHDRGGHLCRQFRGSARPAIDPASGRSLAYRDGHRYPRKPDLPGAPGGERQGGVRRLPRGPGVGQDQGNRHGGLGNDPDLSGHADHGPAGRHRDPAGKATRGDDQAPLAEATRVEIPVSATFTQGSAEQTFVWIVDEQSQTLSRRAVKTGALTDRGIQVLEGLEPGEWIVTAGVNAAKEGQKVRILEN
jgi:hypothetical protein